MAVKIKNCRCGNVYAHEDCEEGTCPVCGKEGKESTVRLHSCGNCKIEGCSEDRVQHVVESGLCMHYRCKDPVRYKR